MCRFAFTRQSRGNMTDNFEKKIDKYYTYLCKQDISFGLNKNTGWSIARQEHEPGKAPTFESPLRYIGFGLSEGSAKAEAIELQLKEIKRRKQIPVQLYSAA